jgi:hypothetical protein
MRQGAKVLGRQAYHPQMAKGVNGGVTPIDMENREARQNRVISGWDNRFDF